jgi:hypothetical protein
VFLLGLSDEAPWLLLGMLVLWRTTGFTPRIRHTITGAVLVELLLVQSALMTVCAVGPFAQTLWNERTLGGFSPLRLGAFAVGAFAFVLLSLPVDWRPGWLPLTGKWLRLAVASLGIAGVLQMYPAPTHVCRPSCTGSAGLPSRCGCSG